MKCKQCTTCCRHVAIQIDKPKSKKDFKEIIWYIMHKDVQVFVCHENDWYIEFKADCKALNNKGNCSIYTQRPDICKEYSAEDCECNGDGSPYRILFTSKQDVENYVEKNTNIKSLY